jgi:hypothetical protein
MGQTADICNRLLDATPPADLLAASLEAFCFTLAACHAHQDPSNPRFTAFVMAAVHAAEGRDAIAFAPALVSVGPAGSTDLGVAGRDDDASGGSAADIAGLCMLLAARLQQLASTAATAADRRACTDGAQSARTIHQLLCGHAPA